MQPFFQAITLAAISLRLRRVNKYFKEHGLVGEISVMLTLVPSAQSKPAIALFDDIMMLRDEVHPCLAEERHRYRPDGEP